MKLFGLFLVLLVSTQAFAQKSYGWRMSVGASKISAKQDINPPIYQQKFAPSGQLGLFCLQPITAATELGIEINWSQITSVEKYGMDFYDSQGNDQGYVRSTYTTHISYLSVPLYYGIKFKHISANAGFQCAYRVADSEHYKAHGVMDDSPFKTEADHDNLNIHAFDFGPRLGIVYKLTGAVSLEGLYYYGLTDICKANSNNRESHIQQITFGIRYYLKIVRTQTD